MSDSRPLLKRSSKSANPHIEGLQVLSFPLEKRPKATRASLPKVRTGCITCKKRHVKCDEAKPGCDRCMRWRGYCGGYGGSMTASCSSDAESETGVSRSNSTKSTRSSKPLSRPSSRRSSRPTSSSSIDPRLDETLEGQAPQTDPEPAESYFKKLLGAKMEDLCCAPISFNSADGLFPEGFWQDSMPNIIQSSPQLMYANLAVQTIGLCERPNPKFFGRAFNPETARARAFQYYGLALQCVGQAGYTVSTVDDLRNAILFSLFCATFDILNKAHAAAEQHFLGGQKMANELMRVETPADVRRVGKGLTWELHNLINFCKHQAEAESSMDRWRQGFEIYGHVWLGKDWTDEEQWEETPLLEFTIIPLAFATHLSVDGAYVI